MLIDWFTISAQALNFLILVWLLKRFLYKPILNAIDAREKRIAKELTDANVKKAEAQRERAKFQLKNEVFAQQRSALLSKATDEAQSERLRLLEEARQDVARFRAKHQETLKDEERSLHQAIIRQTYQELFAIARKALTDLAGTSLEGRMVEVFVHRLRELEGEEKVRLTSALKASSFPLIVRTTFDLSEPQCTATEDAIRENLGRDIHVRFETTPDLISGIELTANGQKVAWSIAEYLTSMEQRVSELLQEKAMPDDTTVNPTEEPPLTPGNE